MDEILAGLKPGYQLVNQYIEEMLDCGVGCHAGCMRSMIWLLGFLMMKTRAHYTDFVEYLRNLRPCMNVAEVLWMGTQLHYVQQTIWTWIPEEDVMIFPVAIKDISEIEAIMMNTKHIRRQPTTPYACSGSYHVADGPLDCKDP